MLYGLNLISTLCDLDSDIIIYHGGVILGAPTKLFARPNFNKILVKLKGCTGVIVLWCGEFWTLIPNITPHDVG